MRKFWLSFVVLIILITPSTILAQEVSPQTKKNVIKNFKADLSQYSALGDDCSRKPEGDANCDTLINDFDLSIWQVEFNTSNSPKRSDFNSDGVINLLDFGVWRNTKYPSSSISSLLDNLFSKFSTIYKTSLVYAQETAPNTLNNSQALISGSGNSTVINSENNGSTAQLNFDSDAQLLNSQFFDSNGNILAGISYLNNGDTTISTQEDGIQIQVTKTATGPVIETFRNPDGTLATIKSWPTQASYNRKDPPLSVTIPGQGNTRNVLNMQPNGDAVLEKITNNLLTTRNQMRANGTLITEDIPNQTLVQSNPNTGFTTITMTNNLGGQTIYMLFKGELYAVTQTNSKNEAFISKPANTDGNSWTFETWINGAKKSEETVSDPIAKLGANTPNPAELIKYINYYKSLPSNQNNVNFSDGFTTNNFQTRVTKANEILNINQSQPPAVLGLSIVKEAFAQEGRVISHTQTPEGPGTTTVVHVTVFEGGLGGQANQVVQVSVFDLTTGSRTDAASVAPTGIDVKSLEATEKTPSQAITDVQKELGTAGQSTAIGFNTPVNSVSVPATTEPAAAAPAAQPAAPAPAAPPPAAPAAPPVGPATSQACEGACGVARGAYESYVSGRTSEAESVASWASRTGSSLTEEQRQDVEAIGAAQSSFFNSIMNNPGVTQEAKDAFSNFIEKGGAAGMEDAAQKAGVPSGAIGVAQGLANQAVQDRPGAQTAMGGIPGIQQAHTDGPAAPGGAGTGAAPSAAGPAAAAAAGIADPVSGFIGNTGAYSQVTQNLGGGSFVSEITNGPGGEHIATQTHNPGTGYSQWSDSRGTTTTEAGAVTAYSPVENPFAPGTTYATTADGSIVAVGRTDFDANGHVSGGRSISGPELDFARESLGRQSDETRNTTGVDGIDFSVAGSTCFLPGTLISTPEGPKAIETLKPGNKVYSFNELTREKEISDFGELSIKPETEYLILNNKIKTTTYHRFYIQTGTSLILKRADQLKIGEFMIDENKNPIPLTSIQKITENVTVYNLLRVSPNKNFFAESILVHNEYGYSPNDHPDTVTDPETGESIPAEAQTSYDPSSWSDGQYGGSVGGGGKGSVDATGWGQATGDWGQQPSGGQPEGTTEGQGEGEGEGEGDGGAGAGPDESATSGPSNEGTPSNEGDGGSSQMSTDVSSDTGGGNQNEGNTSF